MQHFPRISVVILTLALTACGPKTESPPGAPKAAPAKSARALPTGPTFSGQGTVVSLDRARIVLDHDAAPGGLPAGRTTFEADAAVLAEAPIAPGARVAFSYQDWKPTPLLVEMKAR